MTRENKIALVIGFAILLVVGVLLSDHLAQTARGEAADMSSIKDPTNVPAGKDIIFVALTKRLPVADEPASETPPSEVPLPLTKPGDHAPMHIVKAGETLSSIARDHYGDARLADVLAASNPLPDPDNLAVGLRLLIPPQPDVLGATDTVAPKKATSTESVTFSTYTVKSGDTLSELAQSLMGTMHAADELLTMNKGTLKNPRGLRAGMMLRYQPPTAP